VKNKRFKISNQQKLKEEIGTWLLPKECTTSDKFLTT
jgi:hypothetical protein